MIESITWISVDDEMPDEGIDVLLKTPSPSIPVWIGHYDSDEGWWYCDSTRVAYRVTHWAEIPGGPKE